MRLLERACLLVLAAGAVVAQADPVDLKPFHATYGASWKGMSAASATLELKSVGADTYVYETVNKPRGMFRMALPDSLVQSSRFKLVDGRIVPQVFQGSDEKERPANLNFDWDRKRVTGVAKGQSVDLEVQEGTQDPMSMQLASLRGLASGNLQGTVRLIDGDKLKDYELRREGTASLETALGTLDTIIYTSKRAGGDRLTRTWVAPALGYLPVKAERIRKNKVEFTLVIESVE